MGLAVSGATIPLGSSDSGSAPLTMTALEHSGLEKVKGALFLGFLAALLLRCLGPQRH